MNLDTEFRMYHLAVVDLLVEEDDLKKEQADLDDHDDRVTGVLCCLAHLATPEEQAEKPKFDPWRGSAEETFTLGSLPSKSF